MKESELLKVITDFSEDDWKWLTRTAAKYHVEIIDVIDQLFSVYLPDGVQVEPTMTKKEKIKYLNDLTVSIVRKARCQIQ